MEVLDTRIIKKFVGIKRVKQSLGRIKIQVADLVQYCDTNTGQDDGLPTLFWRDISDSEWQEVENEINNFEYVNNVGYVSK